MGGKWTAYRIQGEETIDRILKEDSVLKSRVKHEEGQTLNFNLIGSYCKSEVTDGIKFHNDVLFKRYQDHFTYAYDVTEEVAKHIVREYGTTGARVLELGKHTKLNERLIEDQPFLKSEVLFAIRYQMAQKPNDVVFRRVPVSFLNSKAAAEQVLP